MNILKNSDGEIIGFGEVEFNPEPGQSVEEIQATLEEFAARFRLSADKTTIDADGIDEAVVTIYTNLGVASIDLLVNGVPVTVAIVDGVGQLDPIVGNVAGTVLVESADKTVYSAAGNGSILITVREA